MRKQSCFTTMSYLMLTLLVAGSASAAPWKFGVMADTQWISQTTPVATDNSRAPNSVPVDIIQALNQQFLNKGVNFVIQVGDLNDGGSVLGEDTRALYSQDLYNGGIGFFPFRGNHDSSAAAGLEFQRLYPQTQGGAMNSTPSTIFNASVTGAIQPMPSVVGGPFASGASNFSSPVTLTGSADNSLKGLSYSFDYNNFRFVMIDGQAAAGTDGKTPGIDPQLSWINDRLSSRPSGSHAIVMSHKGLITENHVDTVFGSYPYSDPTGQNTFFGSLQANGVRYYVEGHDHMHDRSIVRSPDGLSSVQNILCASDSSKFYSPAIPANDVVYNTSTHPGITGPRQTQLAQELYTIGYYVYTVDGPRVNVDYYSAPTAHVANNCSGANCEHLITNTNGLNLNFVKAESFGYSLNGREFLVAQGAPYSAVNDTYVGPATTTTAKILSGSNGSSTVDYSGRHTVKAVDTGWTDKSGAAVSNMLTLWGMNELYAANTDTYTLSLSYDPNAVTPAQLQSGLFGLATKDAGGNFVSALNGNSGAALKFVAGPWSADYGLGSYGIDASTNTAWAVVNHAGDFAVAPFNMTDVSAKVTAKASGTIYNRATQIYNASITITNSGNAALNGPLAIALNNLSAGVTLINATGSNNGSPYLAQVVSLSPGASVSIPVQFSNPSNARINFTITTSQI